MGGGGGGRALPTPPPPPKKKKKKGKGKGERERKEEWKEERKLRGRGPTFKIRPIGSFGEHFQLYPLEAYNLISIMNWIKDVIIV